MLTVTEINEAVKNIQSIAKDDEAAHSAEDDLYHRVLHAISIGDCADPAACATAALRTGDIAFFRWCA